MEFSPGLESFFGDKKEKKQTKQLDSACSALWPQLHRDSVFSSLGIDLFSFLLIL